MLAAKETLCRSRDLPRKTLFLELMPIGHLHRTAPPRMRAFADATGATAPLGMGGAQNPIGARQTIADSHADPEFQETISVSGRSGGARCPADEQELTQLSKSVWIEGDKAGW